MAGLGLRGKAQAPAPPTQQPHQPTQPPAHTPRGFFRFWKCRMPYFQALRPPVPHTAPNGDPLLSVPLASGGSAVLHRDDYERLIELGYSPNFTRNFDRGHRGYVVTHAPGLRGSIVTVARLITNAGKGQIVKYQDKDRANLLRSNLYLTTGFARDRVAADMRRRRYDLSDGGF